MGGGRLPRPNCEFVHGNRYSAARMVADDSSMVFRAKWIMNDDRGLKARNGVLALRARPTMSTEEGHRTISQEQDHERRT